MSSSMSPPLPGDVLDTSDPDYVRAMTRLLHAVQELSLARTLVDIQRIVRTSARELTGCDGATFVLRDDGKCYYADEDAISPLWKGSRFPLDACISGWTMLNRQAAVVPDIYRDPRIPHEAYRPTFVQSLVMVPIRTLEPVGAIGNYWAREHQPTSREVALLRALADATSVAMENVQVYAQLEQRVRDRTAALEEANEEIRRLLLTDDLTSLNNRRGFYLLADAALSAAGTHGHASALVFLDVDGLKRVNDECGHDAGDSLIVDVADVLRDVVGGSDIAARLSGDEFCVLVPQFTDDTGVLTARLVDAVRRFNETQARRYHVSVSIGAIAVPHTDVSTLDQLLARADTLMYADKKAKSTLDIA